MKKFYWFLASVIIFEVIIFGVNIFFTNKHILQSKKYFVYFQNESEKFISLINERQEKTEKNISKSNSQLTSNIEVFLSTKDKQNQTLLNNILDTGYNNRKLIEQIHLFPDSYITETDNTDNNENTIIESDFLLQTLLDQGFSTYSNNDFTKAVKIYKKILDIDSDNKEALCYFNASLYFQNPGDESNFFKIKKALLPLLETKTLSSDQKLTTLNVLIGISREEGDSAFIKQYQDDLQELEEENK